MVPNYPAEPKPQAASKQELPHEGLSEGLATDLGASE